MAAGSHEVLEHGVERPLEEVHQNGEVEGLRRQGRRSGEIHDARGDGETALRRARRHELQRHRAQVPGFDFPAAACQLQGMPAAPAGQIDCATRPTSASRLRRLSRKEAERSEEEGIRRTRGLRAPLAVLPVPALPLARGSFGLRHEPRLVSRTGYRSTLVFSWKSKPTAMRSWAGLICATMLTVRAPSAERQLSDAVPDSASGVPGARAMSAKRRE